MIPNHPTSIGVHVLLYMYIAVGLAKENRGMNMKFKGA